jgi:hypothetical protein
VERNPAVRGSLERSAVLKRGSPYITLMILIKLTRGGHEYPGLKRDGR